MSDAQGVQDGKEDCWLRLESLKSGLRDRAAYLAAHANDADLTKDSTMLVIAEICSTMGDVLETFACLRPRGTKPPEVSQSGIPQEVRQRATMPPADNRIRTLMRPPPRASDRMSIGMPPPMASDRMSITTGMRIGIPPPMAIQSDEEDSDEEDSDEEVYSWAGEVTPMSVSAPSTSTAAAAAAAAEVLTTSVADITTAMASAFTADITANTAPLSSGLEGNEPDFGIGFELPHVGPFALERANPHPLDGHLTFTEAEHQYTWMGVALSTSVTQVLKVYFEEFDSEVAIPRMMKGCNWPREQYTTPEGRPFTAQEVKESWDEIGLQARNRGTWTHRNIELMLNHQPHSEVPEMPQFRDFQRDVILARDITPYRTEWRVAAPDVELGGSVDFVGRLPGGGFVLMDWKRSKKVPDSMTQNFGKKCKAPVSHLPDCDGSKYSLQLNLYRYILRRYYEIQIEEMLLVSFHPDLPGYFLAEIPVMDQEIQDIVRELSSRSRSSSISSSSSNNSSNSSSI